MEDEHFSPALQRATADLAESLSKWQPDFSGRGETMLVDMLVDVSGIWQ